MAKFKTRLRVCILYLGLSFTLFSQTQPPEIPGYSFSDPNKVMVQFPTFSYPNDACRIGIDYVVKKYNTQTNTAGEIVLSVNADENDPLVLPQNNHPYEGWFMLPLGSYQITYKNTSPTNNAPSALVLFRHYLASEGYIYIKDRPDGDPNFLNSVDVLKHKQVLKNQTETFVFTLTDDKISSYQTFINNWSVNNCGSNQNPGYCTGNYLVKTVYFSPRQNNQLYIVDPFNGNENWEIGTMNPDGNGYLQEPSSYSSYYQQNGFTVKQEDSNNIIYKKIRLRSNNNTYITIAVRVNGQNQNGQFKILSSNNLTPISDDITITNYFRWWTESRYQYSHFDKYYGENTPNDPQAELITKYKMSCNKMWVDGNGLTFLPPSGTTIESYCNYQNNPDPNCKINIALVESPVTNCIENQTNKNFGWIVNNSIYGTDLQLSMDNVNWSDGGSTPLSTSFDSFVYVRIKATPTETGKFRIKVNGCNTNSVFTPCIPIGTPLCSVGIAEDNLNLPQNGSANTIHVAGGFYMQDAPEWLEVTGNYEGDFSISATPNNSNNSRTCKISFACYWDDDSPHELLVSQAGIVRPVDCNITVSMVGDAANTNSGSSTTKTIPWVINGNLYGSDYQFSTDNTNWYDGTAMWLNTNQEANVKVRYKWNHSKKASFNVKSNSNGVPATFTPCNSEPLQIVPPNPNANCNIAITLVGDATHTNYGSSTTKTIPWVINGNLYGNNYQYSLNNIDWTDGTAMWMEINQERTVYVRYKNNHNFKGSFNVKSNANGVPATFTNCYGMAVGARKKIVEIDSEGEINSENSITVSPNPVSENFLFAFNLSKEYPIKIRIFDSIGLEILNKNTKTIQKQEIEFSLSKYPSGLYFISLETDKRIINKKIIKR